MRAWKRSSWSKPLCLLLSVFTAAAAVGCGAGGRDGVAGGAARAALSGAPGSAPPAPPAEESQGGFVDPPTSTGAFVHRIPIEVPPGIGALVPDVALAYSSQGGVGAAGVGWDLPMAMITLNHADGTRPLTVEADIMRYPERTPVERYASNFGVIAELREPGSYVTSAKSYLFTAHNDARVEPIPDHTGAREYTGEKAAWLVTMKDGTTYRYGYEEQSSLWRDEGVGSKTKVGWMLDRVEDRHGNRMRYDYEEYPGGQDTYRHPVLRAVEYGIPASRQNTPARMVVLFDYVQSPWKRTSYSLGTRTDFAYLVDRICTIARGTVVEGTTPGGHTSWSVPGSDGTSPTDNLTKTGCTQLTYQFEDAATYPAGYTERPLLVKVERQTRDGTSQPPWTFTYTQQSTRWNDVYQSSVDAGGTPWAMPDRTSLERSTLDIESEMADVNGDSLADIIEGRTDGTVDVSLATPDASGGLHYDRTTWPHPLATGASPVDLSVTPVDVDDDSTDSDVWYHFVATLSWGAGAGLGYARPLTAAPQAVDNVWNHSGSDGNWNEDEASSLPLGALRFLHSSFGGPRPSVGMRNWVDRADTIDQLETYGAFKDRIKNEAAFDFRTSDGQDGGDRFDIDQCWSVGSGPTTGALGADLDCFDEPGSRFFAASGVTDGNERGYASELWTEDDLDGDGLVDLVFAAPVIVRDADGRVRDLPGGDNDLYWAPGTGSGWGPLQPWTVPRKSPGLSDVGTVHGTGLLGVSVSDSELKANRVWGGGLNLGVGFTGWSVGPTIVTPAGAVGLPSVGGGWGSSASWSSVAQSAAVNGGFTAAALAGASQRSLNAAARSLDAVQAAQNPLSAFPSLGVGMNWTNKGPYFVFHLWVFGDVAVKFGLDPTVARSYGYQGMVDLTGDGRPDLVSAKFGTPSGGINSTASWLVYRNNGRGFEPPEVIRFALAPRTAAGSNLGPPSEAITSMSRSLTSNYADTLSWVPGGWDVFPIGVLEQEWGLADLNSDGLADLIDTTPQGCTASNGVMEQCWTVYFSLGHEFTGPVQWHFAGDWQQQAGPNCTRVYAFPRLSRSVYGQTAEEQGDLPRIVQGRQVQWMADVNGDGKQDYVYEQPAPVNDTDGYCDYINPSSNFHDAMEISDRVSPYRLHRKLLVRLNNGSGFGAPVAWVDTHGFSLSGVTVVGSGDRPTDQTSYAALGVGDFDADGAPDLGVRADGDWYNLPGDAEINRLYKLGEANVDVLESATSPDGGRLEIAYRYQRPDAHLAGGQWVTSSVRMVDPEPGRLDTSRLYYYEGGSYDRAHRTFQGFERVYQVTQGSAGYTLSRYYQSPGLENQPYCRAVRRLGGAAGQIASLTAARAQAWADAPLGQKRAGWVAPVAIGDAAHADALAGPLALPDDAADAAAGPDAPEKSDDAYGAPPSGATGDDPAEEADEDGRSDNDESTTPPVDTPEWPPLESSDVTAWSSSSLPLDVSSPAVTVPWHPEDSGTIPWWNLPVYTGDCNPGSGGGASFVCRSRDVDLASLACGDADDPGTLVVEDFSVRGDFSTIPDVHTVRPRVASKRVYDPSGGHPIVTGSDLEYDELGDVVLSTDLGDLATPADDLVTATTYKATAAAQHVLGKPCQVTVKDGAGSTLSRTRFAYDGATGFACTVSVPVGDVTRTERAIDAATTVTESFAYSPEGLVTSHTPPRGAATTTAYDPSFPWYAVSQSRTVASASGPITLTTQTRWLGVNKLSFTHFGLVGEEVDPNGDVTGHTYDDFLRPLTLVRPGDNASAPTERWTYHDWNGDPADRRTVSHARRFDAALEVATTTIYDGFGQLERVAQPPPDNLAGCTGSCTDVTQEMSYDADGRIVESHHPYFTNSADAPHLTRTSYDLLGQVTSVTGPNGSRTVTGYDRDLTSVADPDGLVTVTRTDARGHQTGVYRYSGGGAALYSGIENTYRPDGVLTGTVDAAGNRWSFAFDLLGRQTSSTDANTGTKSLVYDENGNTVVVTDDRYASLGLAMATGYDALDRPVLREVRLGTTVNGRTLQGGKINESTVYLHDVDPAVFPDAKLACPDNHLGKLTRVAQYLDTGTLTEVSRKEYCYDDRGRVAKLAQTIGGQTYTFEYTYGSADQLLTQKYPDGDVVTGTYDRSGRLSTTSNVAGPLLAESKAQADGQPIRRVMGAGNVKQRFCYEDGASGAVLARMVAGGASMSFGCTSDQAPVAGAVYDVRYTRTAAGRLETRDEAFERPGTGLEEHHADYGYDEVLRLASETYDGATTSFEHDTLDDLTEIGGAAQTFGASGRATRGAGPNAILSGAGGRTFSYDKAGNVLSMTSGGSTIGFGRAFDGQPLLVTRDGLTNPVVYYYDEAGRRVLRTQGGAARFYAGPYQDDGATRRTFYPGIGVKVDTAQYYTLSDPAGSTSLLLDASGAVVQYLAYEPYGGQRESAAFDPDPADGLVPYQTDVLFGGKERDSAFGAEDDIYDFGPRMYFADVGTWLAADQTYDDGPNRYAFVQGDPINNRDPTGDATYAGWGHHIVVQEIYRGSSKYSGKFTAEVMGIFDQWTSGPLEIHNFDGPHAAYNQAVVDEVEEFGKIIGKTDTMAWTARDAEDFVAHVMMSDKPAISKYLDFIATKIGPLRPNQARNMLTALNKGDRFLARWVLVARKIPDLGPLLDGGAALATFPDYLDEEHGNVDAAYSSWRIETAFDLGTLGLLRSPPLGKDNLDFAIEDYVDTWQDYSEGQCTQP